LSQTVQNSNAGPTVFTRSSQVTCVYLFHELPAAVRRKAAAEMARVCKPGGMVVSMRMSMALTSI
jgi:ubiquinone/menaquinone biosynthesis C-methylase UbiE